MEIRNAENIVEKLNTGARVNPDQPIIVSKTWNRFNYLFVGDLDRDEFALINKFYSDCLLISNALPQLSIISQLREKSKNVHIELSTIARELVMSQKETKESLKELFSKKKEEFMELYGNDGTIWRPHAPQNDLQQALLNFEKVTTTTAGEKLKRLSA